MKMITRALLLAAGLTTSLSALAVANVDSTDITGGTTGECVLLADDVKVVRSNKVHAAYDCNEVTGAIKFAACHEGGSRQAKSTTCTEIGTDENGDPLWSDDSCAAATDVYDIADYRGFTATSSGGSIGEQQLGGRCSDATVLALPVFTQ